MNSKPMIPGGFPQPKKIDLGHYLRLIYDKKYWIIAITILVSVVWLFISPMIISENVKLYEFKALIRFEDPRSVRSASVYDESFASMETESKLSLLNTRNFLEQVADALNLNVQSRTSGVSRIDLFRTVNLKEDYKRGQYKIKKEKDQLLVYFTNDEDKIENELIKRIQPENDQSYVLNIHGLELTGNLDVFEEHREIEFSVSSKGAVAQSLRNRLNYQINREKTLLTLNLEYGDFKLGAAITNTIADLFLKTSFEIKQARTNTVLASLEEQLESSRQQLEKAENELRRFRERNPSVLLTENLTELTRTLSGNEVDRNNIVESIDHIQRLMKEKEQAREVSEIDLLYQEITNFLDRQSTVGSSTLSQQYFNNVAQKNAILSQGFGETNPRYQELDKQTRLLREKIDERANQFLDRQVERSTQLGNFMTTMERRLTQNPGKEIELAKLQRESQTKAQVYSNILRRYNEVQVAHASITPDAYLVEGAEIPVVYSNIIDRIRRLIPIIIGPLLGLALSLGLFIGYDFIWHRARSVDDMEQILNLPVLDTIPVIKSVNEVPSDFEGQRKMDPKLITIDYAPSPEAEAFRNIRTRLILHKSDENERQELIVTSLLPNEGKSLIAANLAVTFAQLKKQTLLIDCDLRRGVIHNSFAANKKPGLTDFLARGKAVNQESMSKVIQQTTIPYLYLLSSGTSIPNPGEILMSQKMQDLIQSLRKRFHFIIFDTPPIEFIPDALVLNRVVHNMILVTRYAKTDLNKLNKKLKEFPDLKQDLQGVVLNAAMGIKEKDYYSYSYYKY